MLLEFAAGKIADAQLGNPGERRPAQLLGHLLAPVVGPAAALGDPNPVLLFEHIALYNAEGKIDGPVRLLDKNWRRAWPKPLSTTWMRRSVTPLQSCEHPASRQRSSVLGDDKAGRELSGHGFGGAAFEPHIDAQHKEHLEFARELGERLERGAQEGRCESIALFASSPFLGELKQALGPGAQRLLAGAHDVDLTAVGLAELQQRIRHELSQAP